MDCDVVIVGAGAAGLIAARELARAGRSVTLLEGRDRLGGRLLEIAHPGAGAPIELGGEFVHGRPAVTYGLLREIGSTVIDTAGTGFTQRDAKLERDSDDAFEAAAALLAGALTRATDESVDALIERELRASGSRAGDLARRVVGGFDAADPARASARAIAQEWSGDASIDSAQARPLGGYAPLIAGLARSFPADRVHMRLATIVDAIQRDARGVRVNARCAGRELSYTARHAVVTVPHGVLAAAPDAHGAIAFEPPLPSATQDAIRGIAMGPVVKVVLCFRAPFWESLAADAWRDAAFISGEAAFPTLWTQLPVRANTLVAWAGGPAAQRLAGASADECVALALQCAGQYFGAQDAANAAFEVAYTHDWQRDPLARGAYSYVVVGAERARELLSVPVDGGLWFAGEATAGGGEGGTVAGALESGVRVARAIVAGHHALYA